MTSKVKFYSFIVHIAFNIGLFHNAIAQSGSALDPEHFEQDPLSKAIDLAESLGCPTSDTADLAACLHEVDFKKIIQIKFSVSHSFFEKFVLILI